jgi:hypothetical protein
VLPGRSRVARSRVDHQHGARDDAPSSQRAPSRRLEISFSQGAEWNALISKYIGTIPLSGDAPCAAEQSRSGRPPPRTTVSSAMIAKVGAAASDIQSAAPSAGRACLPWLRFIGSMAPEADSTRISHEAFHLSFPRYAGFRSSAARFRKAASPASDTLTHFGSGAASGTYRSCQFHHLYGRLRG